MKSYFRFLSRNKLYTTIEVVGLSIALAFVIVLSSYIVNDMSVNKVLKNTDDVYIVHGLERSNCFSEVPALYEAMTEIKSSCGMVHSGRNPSLFDDLTTVSNGDKKMNAKILGASDTFFDFFTFPLLEGDPGNALSSKYSVVISEEMANTFFPDGDALGKEINVSERNPFWQWSDEPVEDLNVNLTVTGIFKPFSRTVFIEPDMIMNLDLIFEKQESLFGGGMRIAEYSFVKLDKAADPNSLCSTLTTEFKKVARNYDTDYFKMELVLTPFDDIKKQDPQTFGYHFDNIRQGRLFGIYLLMCIFIAIVSLLDYIVLTIAFSRFRIKEIATRQLLGTDREGIIGRCFAEAFILLAISCIFAVIIALAFKDPIGQILGAEINPLSQLNEYLILAGIIVIMVAIASAVPSLILSSYSAVNVIKGEARYKDKVTFSKVFIGLAGLLSIGALSVCFGVTRQTLHLINQPLGYEYDDMIYTEFITEDNRFFDELESLPFVEKVGATTSLPTSWIMTGLRDNTTGKYDKVAFIDGNSSFFEMIGVEILEDTGLGTTMSEGGKWYICKSSKEGISQYMTDGMLNFFTPVPLGGTISDIKIGLVKENAYSKNAFINVIDMPEWIQYAYPVAKVNINEDKAKQEIYDFYRSKGYDDNMFIVSTLREIVEKEIKEEKNMLKLLTGFSFICILMTIMTIVGLSSYHAKTGEKDNAIRNVFGCSRKEMIRKITLDFTLPVVISAVVAIPIAYTVIGRWMEGYVIRTDNSPLIYIGAFAVVLSVTLAAVALQTLRLMRTNPAEALKKE